MFLKTRNADFPNTLALAEPSGKIVGAVRKRSPSLWEACFFKGQRGVQNLDIDLGRVGVGICFDTHTFEVAFEIARGCVNLMRMPHSFSTLFRSR